MTARLLPAELRRIGSATQELIARRVLFRSDAEIATARAAVVEAVRAALSRVLRDHAALVAGAVAELVRDLQADERARAVYDWESPRAPVLETNEVGATSGVVPADVAGPGPTPTPPLPLSPSGAAGRA